MSGLAPGELIAVTATTPRVAGVWSATATFKADRAGVVDLAGSAPTAGSYSGVSPMGLFWSEHMISHAARPSNEATTTTLRATAGGHQLASARVIQRFVGPGVTASLARVQQVGFFGEFFRPRAGVRRPAVVMWGGSEGRNALLEDAALLASHGIPALAVAYFDEPGLPCRLQDIPLAYFVKAIDWLRSRPDVDPSRVWILSASRGTEAELLVAAHWPGLVHGVVAESPSSFPNGSYPGTCTTTGTIGRAPAWTLDGKPVSTSEPIPVQHITGPVMLVSGGQDAVWASEQYAGQIMSALPHDGSDHENLVYPDAGHVVLAIPYGPTTLADGGTPAANEGAHERDWPGMIAFVTTH